MMRLFSSLLVLASVACGGSPIPRPTEADRARGAARFPDLTLTELTQGRTLYVSRCGSCHTLRRPAELTARQWETEVGEMREKNGVKLSDTEARAIVRYLAVSSGS